MERLLKQYDKEFMKMAMLKHEETFKEQVYELHRLYRIQKLLMNDLMKRSVTSTRPHECGSERWNKETELRVNYGYRHQQYPQTKINLEVPAEEYTANDSKDVMPQIEQETDIELTLGWGSTQSKKDEILLGSDSRPTLSSSSTGSTTKKQTSNQPSRGKNAGEKLTGTDWGPFQIPDLGSSFQSEKKNAYTMEEQLKQEKLNQPPWLLHVLNLNMT